jgi:hypothetical protein
VSRATLERALAYQNDSIPRRFVDEWDIELDESRALFDDVKRWLYLCGLDEPGLAPMIYGPLSILDEAWHNFVLFTPEYTAYCRDVFGRYIHHLPTTHDERNRFRAELAGQPGTGAQVVETRARQRDAIIEHLGVETLIRWYVDFPQRYDTEFFATRRKPITVDWRADAELVALAAELRSSG